MSPNNENDRFYEVTVAISTEDEKGRVKKQNYKYLIDAASTADAEKNTYKLMDGTIDDWEIASISVSKIKEVYMSNEI
jgi:hypothetical protein